MTMTGVAGAAARGRAFPTGFLWGVATSAYQIEGAVDADGRGRSVWDTFSHTPGKVRGNDTGDVACDFYHRFEEDLDLLVNLGLNTFRFSVAWPRVQPSGRGPANEAGLDFYRTLVDGLRRRGITPAVTLHHWDLPQALEDAGGWADRDTAHRFAEYAGIVAGALGDAGGLWMTLNEPQQIAHQGYRVGTHAPGHTDDALAAAATHHLLLAHGLAVQVLRSQLDPSARVGISLDLHPVRAVGQEARHEAAISDAETNRIFFDPVVHGRYPQAARAHIVPPPALIAPGDMELIGAPIDFLGINYYSPHYVKLANGAAAGTGGTPIAGRPGVLDFKPADIPRTTMDWLIEPDGLFETLVEVDAETPPSLGALHHRERLRLRGRHRLARSGRGLRAGRLPARAPRGRSTGDRVRRPAGRLLPLVPDGQLRVGLGLFVEALRPSCSWTSRDAAARAQAQRPLPLADRQRERAAGDRRLMAARRPEGRVAPAGAARARPAPPAPDGARPLATCDVRPARVTRSARPGLTTQQTDRGGLGWADRPIAPSPPERRTLTRRGFSHTHIVCTTEVHMKRLPPVAVGLAMAACAAIAFPAVAAAQDSNAQGNQAGAGFQGWVYTDSNNPITGLNSVLALKTQPNGATSPVHIKEYLTGGTGAPFVLGGPPGTLAGDHEVLTSDDNQFLFAVNQGSNTIAVFKIDRGGRELDAVPGSPFPSGGVAPISIGYRNGLLVVANHGAPPGASTPPGPSNLTSFQVRGDGSLKQISTLTEGPEGLIDANISPDGHEIVTTGFYSQLIHAVTLSNKGILAEAPGSPAPFPASMNAGVMTPWFLPPALIPLPFGVGFSPNGPYAYVVGAVNQRVAIYKIGANGALTFTGQADNPGGVAGCWIQVTQNGRHAYVSNSFSQDITQFNVSANGANLTFVARYPLPSTGTDGQLELSPNDNAIYVLGAHDDSDAPRPQGVPASPGPILDAPADGNFLESYSIAANGALIHTATTALPVRFSDLPTGLATISGLALRREPPLPPRRRAGQLPGPPRLCSLGCAVSAGGEAYTRAPCWTPGMTRRRERPQVVSWRPPGRLSSIRMRGGAGSLLAIRHREPAGDQRQERPVWRARARMASGPREVAVPGRHQDGLARVKVTHRHHAPVHHRERAVAAVAHTPLGPAHRRRGVAPAGGEVALHVGGQRLQDLRGLLRGGRAHARARAGARAARVARRPAEGALEQLQRRQPLLRALLEDLEQPAAEVARVRLLARGRGAHQRKHAAARVDLRAHRELARGGQRHEPLPLGQRSHQRGRPGGRREGRARNRGGARRQLDEHLTADRHQVDDLGHDRRRERRRGR